MNYTQNSLSVSDIAYMNNEKVCDFIESKEDTSKEQIKFAKSLKNMYLRIHKFEERIHSQFQGKEKQEALKKCQKSYGIFNELYSIYANEDCELFDEIYSFDIPTEEIKFLIKQFNEKKKSFNDRDITLEELKSELESVQVVKKADDCLKLVEENKFPMMLMADNGIRKDARKLGLSKENIDTAVELLQNR